MPQQVLPILEAHPGGPKTAAEGVLEIVHPNLLQALPCLCARSHALFSIRVIGLPW